MYTPDFFDWIAQHASDSPAALRLRYAAKGGFPYSDAILQIECRRKFRKKLLQTLEECPHFVFPNLLSGEQCSSDATADFHASLIEKGASVVDLTAGLGIDVMHIARKAAEVTAVERQEALCNTLLHNAADCGLNNIRAVNSVCEGYLQCAVADGAHYDVAFIDPARRDEVGGRLFALGDCSPDVVQLMPQIKQLCSRLIIKASPMLDISHTLAQLDVKPAHIYVVGTASECKELVVDLDFQASPEDTVITAVTLPSSTFSFTRLEENQCSLGDRVNPKSVRYICEPYPSVLKAGPFKLLSARFCLKDFHPNTHIYAADEVPTAFPGRTFKVLEILPYSSGVIKRFRRSYPEISITARNFGMTADALRARLNVKESSGRLRLFALTAADESRWLYVTETLEE